MTTEVLLLFSVVWGLIAAWGFGLFFKGNDKPIGCFWIAIGITTFIAYNWFGSAGFSYLHERIIATMVVSVIVVGLFFLIAALGA